MACVRYMMCGILSALCKLSAPKYVPMTVHIWCVNECDTPLSWHGSQIIPAWNYYSKLYYFFIFLYKVWTGCLLPPLCSCSWRVSANIVLLLPCHPCYAFNIEKMSDFATDWWSPKFTCVSRCQYSYICQSIIVSTCGCFWPVLSFFRALNLYFVALVPHCRLGLHSSIRWRSAWLNCTCGPPRALSKSKVTLITLFNLPLSQ